MKLNINIRLAGLILLLFSLTAAWGVEIKMLKVDAEVSSAPTPSITISWDTQLPGYEIIIYRRILGEEGSSTWGNSISTNMHPLQSYVDTNVIVGTTYEYKIYRPYYDLTYGAATSYLVAGMESPLTEHRGKIMLIVDDTIATPLATELERLERDLLGDGWTVIRHNSPRHGTGTPEDLKAWIVSKYNEDTTNTKAIFLFGRLPILMSGREAPDGHESIPHATDLFYADVDGSWTDTTINYIGVNVPGDGIYDQNYIADNNVEMQIGRVDLAGMTFWSDSEIELLRNYLNKDHMWRNGQAKDPRRGIYSPDGHGGHLYAEHGHLYSLFEEPSVSEILSWSPETENNPYTWGVSFGDPTLANYPDYNFKMAFTINFGSHKQKWERNNNTMRAILAMPEYGLTCGWGARPYWFFHHMGMGKTIGYSSFRTQNNRNNEYTPAGHYSFAGAIHVNLMGDPTLRMHIVPPPLQVSTSTNITGDIVIEWMAPDSPVLGYHLYRASNISEPFARQTDSLEPSTTFTDTNALAGTNIYMVRAIRLEEASTGTFYNQSQGAFAAYPPKRVSLTVTTPLGIADPPIGTNDYSWYDAALPCSIPISSITDGSTQQVVTGWTGTGDIPVTGTGAITPLIDIKQDSTITWQWATNFWLTVTSDSNGTVNMTNGWHRLGSNVSLLATTTTFRYLFSHWTGSAVPAGHESDNPLLISMDSALDVMANFIPMQNPDNYLPYVESFEQYQSGTLLAGAGGWFSEQTNAAIVTTDTNIINGIIDYGDNYPYPINTTHTKAAKIESYTSIGVVSPSNKVIITKMLIKMREFGHESIPDLSTNDLSLAFAVSTNRYFMLFYANPTSGERDWTTFTNTAVNVDVWHTITMEINYDIIGVGGYRFFKIKINNEPWLSHISGFSSNDHFATPDGPWFALKDPTISNLRGFSFRGIVKLDDFLVSENWQGGGGDYDGDGMWDMWEQQYFGGTNQPNGEATDDYDTDGASNLSEYLADTSPTDTNSVLALTGVTMETNGVAVSWKGGTESKQYLDRADALSRTGTIWRTIQTNMPPVTSTMEILDSDNVDTTQFYRLRAERN